jgi:hypothetical protein
MIARTHSDPGDPIFTGENPILAFQIHVFDVTAGDHRT